MTYRSLAAIAVVLAEVGRTDEAIAAVVDAKMDQVGLGGPADFRHIANAVRTLPEPLDLPATSYERLELLAQDAGVLSIEARLYARLRAHEVLLRVANGSW